MGRFNLILILTLYYTNLSVSQQREVKRCFFPNCLDITVNVEEVREVFVTNCRVNKVTVTGDIARFSITIKDNNGLNCEPYERKTDHDQNTETETTPRSPPQEPMTDSATKQPTQEPMTDSATKPPTQEPITDSATKPPTQEPITDSATKPPTQEPITDSATKLPTQEPITDSATKPPTQEPITDSATKPPPLEPMTDSATKPPPLEPITDSATRPPTQEPITDSATKPPPLEPITDSTTRQPPLEPITDSVTKPTPQEPTTVSEQTTTGTLTSTTIDLDASSTWQKAFPKTTKQVTTLLDDLTTGFLAWAVSVTLALIIYFSKKMIKRLLKYLNVQDADIIELTSPQSTVTTLSPAQPQPLETISSTPLPESPISHRLRSKKLYCESPF